MRAVEPLIAAFQRAAETGESESGTRQEAALALGKLGGDRAIETLVQALTHKDSMVRFLAAEGLGYSRDGRAVEPLIRALEDEVYYVRLEAARSLGELGDRRAIPALLRLLEREPDQEANGGEYDFRSAEVRTAASEAIACLQEGAPPR